MKTVIEMAKSVGFWQEHIDTWMCTTEDIKRFAELVRAGEREACAKVCEDFADGNKWSDAHGCAATIRARSDE